ncbi:hypothetical protein MLD38_021274 [Melastoma candidum]|uniref:Uncharacterized protein n=1 Tax=Melastoma candidum TaxID=119954 RepID=A0ACB9QHE2_9MYRT|nr:hypothetical protein MLD38_021274 [Melastoma candidum]
MSMTRCKKHFSDVSSTVGVCASCLRDHLFFVIAFQARTNPLARSQDHLPAFLDNDPAFAFPPDPPPPLLFPRSVSPYVARRHGNDDHSCLTPPLQKVGSTTHDAFPMPESHRSSSRKGRWRRKLSFLQHFVVFRSRSDRVNSDTDHHSRVSAVFDSNSSESSPSLLANLKGRWRNSRQPRRGRNTCHTDDESSHGRSSWTVRPMPDRGFQPESGGECCRGYSSEKATPASVTSRRKGRGHSTEVVGMRFCLSPLVRASPAGRRRATSEAGYPIVVRVPGVAKSGRRGATNNRDG